jgi:uncharacterized protein (TIGR03437 family)
MHSAMDPQAQIILSFLNGTNNWRSIGTAAEDNAILSRNGGLALETRSEADAILPMDSASANSATLSLPTKNVAYNDLLPAAPLAIKTASGPIVTTGTFTLPAGQYKAVVMKAGPIIAGVLPSASRTFPLSVAPGELVSIYGSVLDGGQVFINDAPATVLATAPTQINAIMPDNAAGLVRLKVQNATGSNTVNVLIDPAVPAIFTQNTSGSGAASALNISNQVVTPSAPLRAGDYVQLFVTGLGATTNHDGLDWAIQQPTVTVGGRPCAVSYAGRAPGFRGLDQINCQIPGGLTTDPAAQVIVFSGARGSNIATLAIQ